jgi:hypothetical protein
VPVAVVAALVWMGLSFLAKGALGFWSACASFHGPSFVLFLVCFLFRGVASAQRGAPPNTPPKCAHSAICVAPRPAAFVISHSYEAAR